MKLVNSASGSEINCGTMLHMVAGPTLGQAWRYERITPHDTDGHRVHCTRVHPRMGRVHREFHPRVFGATVVIDVRWYRDIHHTAHRAWLKIDDYLFAGIFALLPLAFFEHYHWAETITEAIGLGH